MSLNHSIILRWGSDTKVYLQFCREMKMRDIRSGEVRDAIDAEIGGYISPVVPPLRKDKLMRRKILHITFSIDTGGLEIFVLRLCEGLRERFDPLLCTFSTGGDLRGRFRKLDVPVYHLTKPEGLPPSCPLRPPTSSILEEMRG